MKEAGLIDYWLNQFVPKIDKCLNKKAKGDPARIRLSMGHLLSGVFVILLVGYVLAVIAFIGEIILGIKRHREMVLKERRREEEKRRREEKERRRRIIIENIKKNALKPQTQQEKEME